MARTRNINGQIVPFTEEEELARDKEEAEWKAQQEATQYQRDRVHHKPATYKTTTTTDKDGVETSTTVLVEEEKLGYPDLGEQLDMIWHAIDAGKLDKTSDFYTKLKKIKDDNPKPE